MNDWNMMVHWLGMVPHIEGTRTLVENDTDTTNSEYTQESRREFDDAMSTRGVKFGSRTMTQGIGKIKKSS